MLNKRSLTVAVITGPLLALAVLAFAWLASESRAAGELDLTLAPYPTLQFPGLTDIAFDPDEGALFISQAGGKIRRLETAPPGALFFLDITDRAAPTEGLLGFTFHPDYADNRFLFVNYRDLNGDTHIARFTANAANTWADPESELTILTVAQPYSDHNGGDLLFGPDGKLYIPLGDGGQPNDPDNQAQDPTSLLGKILRIDVDNVQDVFPMSGSQSLNPPYSVPADNPYVCDPRVLDEIWAFGVRNPWRVSFDRVTGELYIADVGQDRWEEVSLQPAGGGGQNYGWSCYEGAHANPNTSVTDCGLPQEYVSPVAEYEHGPSGCAITGGFVYRGGQFPAMQGRYFFTDYCSGDFWDLARDEQGSWDLRRHDNLQASGLVTFGEDNSGELYVGVFATGEIFHLQGTGAPLPAQSSRAVAEKQRRPAGDTISSGSGAHYCYYAPAMINNLP